MFNFCREDGKDCMKFYTDPGYFFELWFKEIQRDIDTKKAELRKKKEGKRVCMIKRKLRTPLLHHGSEKTDWSLYLV